jgi:hypothetical protein
MKSIVIGVLCFLLGAGVVTGARAYSILGGAYDVDWDRVCVQRVTGSQTVSLVYKRTSDGRAIGRREVSLGTASNQPVRDEFGTQISATTPAAAITARDAYGTQISSLVSSGAGGGLLNP